MKLMPRLAAITLMAMSAACARTPDPVSKGPQTLEEAVSGPSNVAVFMTGDEDTTVYLFGTVHILQPDIQWETEPFTQAWDASDTVFFEVDITSPDAMAEAGALFLEKGFDPNGKQLSTYFDEAEKKKLNDALKPLGLNLGLFTHMRPWFASVNITQAALAKIGGKPEAGIELILGGRATAEGKTSRYFETLEEQVGFLSSGTDEQQADMLLAGLDELVDIEASFAQMVGAWYRGDSEALADIMSEAFAEFPEVVETLLYGRNRNWAAQLDDVIKNEPGTFFVAVGAGHLGGEHSVQDYLEERGYDVRRISGE